MFDLSGPSPERTVRFFNIENAYALHLLYTNSYTTMNRGHAKLHFTYKNKIIQNEIRTTSP
jgi:hypothetical protein